jgi:hypothetical protein
LAFAGAAAEALTGLAAAGAGLAVFFLALAGALAALPAFAFTPPRLTAICGNSAMV